MEWRNISLIRTILALNPNPIRNKNTKSGVSSERRSLACLKIILFVLKIILSVNNRLLSDLTGSSSPGQPWNCRDVATLSSCSLKRFHFRFILCSDYSTESAVRYCVYSMWESTTYAELEFGKTRILRFWTQGIECAVTPLTWAFYFIYDFHSEIVLVCPSSN